jgi:hypothetical protein
MQRFETETIVVHAALIDETFHDRDRQGWELVAAVPIPPLLASNIELYRLFYRRSTALEK